MEFSDGFGRHLQTRTKTEDVIFGDPVFGHSVLSGDQSAPVGCAIGRKRKLSEPVNVVVSGWKIYDNKGQVVERSNLIFLKGGIMHPLLTPR